MSSTTQVKRFLPIVLNDELKEDAYLICFGYMFHPHCTESANQLTQLLQHRVDAFDRGVSPSKLSGEVYSNLPFDKLSLAGEMALLAAQNFADTGELLLGKAAWMVKENHSKDFREYGKKLATSERTIRQHFYDYLPVIHLWAAFQYFTLTEPEILRDFLAMADLIARTLEDANLEKPYFPWSVPEFHEQTFWVLPDEGIVENPEETRALLEKYSARSST